MLSVGVVTLSGQSAPRMTFRSALNLVSVAVVVRHPDGRLVSNLRSTDFEVLDAGVPQEIVHFQSGDGEARLALLVDGSGSMALGPKRLRSQLAAEFLVDGFRGDDAASVFSFDSRVRRLTLFTRDPDEVQSAVSSVEPYRTALPVQRDRHNRADGEPRHAARPGGRSADGRDGHLEHALAGGSGECRGRPRHAALRAGGPGTQSLEAGCQRRRKSAGARDRQSLGLNDLAVRTGGLASEASTTTELRALTQTILTELRHQ